MLIHTGTFDVENYGDLLFPMLVSRRLAPRSVHHISPAGGPALWKDTAQCTRLDAVTRTPLTGIVIGGGNIVHSMPSMLPDYQRTGVDLTGYADLWLVPSLAADKGLPLVWNAPGVPDFFETPFLPLVREALERADYISVRDAQSRTFLAELIPDRDIAIVPDPAWELPAAYPAVQLADRRAKLIAELGGDPAARHVVLHVNARYISNLRRDVLIAEIDGIADALSARPVLVAIGPCHGDGATARMLAAQLHTAPLVLDAPQRMYDIAALISGAEAYVGSSMHGFITAAAYGVPAIMIARGKSKFDGLVQMIGTPDILASTWDGICESFCRRDHAVLLERFRRVQRSAADSLDKHWSTIETVLAMSDGAGRLNPERIAAARARVLGALSRHLQTRNSEQNELLRRAVQSRLPSPTSRNMADLSPPHPEKMKHEDGSSLELRVEFRKAQDEARTERKLRQELRYKVATFTENFDKELDSLSRQLIDARRKPLKNLTDKIISYLLFKLANMETVFSTKHREKFLRSAKKRDPKRDEVAKLKLRLSNVLETF